MQKTPFIAAQWILIVCNGVHAARPKASRLNSLGIAAWNPLHSIMLHGTHCIQSCCIKSTAFNRVPFLHAAWNTLHSNTLPGIHCIQSRSIGPRCMEFTAIKHAAWNPLHSIGMLWAMLDNIHCIQSGFIGPRGFHSFLAEMLHGIQQIAVRENCLNNGLNIRRCP